MDHSLKWKDLTLIAFDTETTGQYPVGFEVCEVAAVKWRGGKVIDEFSTLIKPNKSMSDEVIKIHGITNEMVKHAPKMSEKIKEFHQFISDGVTLAHHAPFDLGFMTFEFEKNFLPLPQHDGLCTSLIARKVIDDSPNHKLQTLIQHLNISQGVAHRALDDAKACLEVGLQCFKKVDQKLGRDATLGDLYQLQVSDLSWKRYSFKDVEDTDIGVPIFNAIRDAGSVDLVYSGGSRPGTSRRVYPLGFVRNPDGDYLIVRDDDEGKDKRYYLNRIVSARRTGF